MAETGKVTRRRLLQAALGLGVAVSAASLGVLGFALREQGGLRGKLGRIPPRIAGGEYHAGEFILSLGPDRLTISHSSSPDGVLWESIPGDSFLCGAVGNETVSEVRAHFSIEDSIQRTYAAQTVDRIERRGESLTLHGRLSGEQGETAYRLSFSPETQHRLRFEAEADPPCNRLYLTYASSRKERFFGFGAQYTHFDLKGRRVPIFIQEQGIGRGAQPVTLAAELRAGGSWHASYACVPHYVTSELRSLFLENREYSAFDLRRPESVQIEVFSGRMSGQIVHGDTPAELIEHYTEYAGRIPKLPDWAHNGAVLGLQGGTETVSKRYEKIREAGAPVAALWLQDWVGQRRTRASAPSSGGTGSWTATITPTGRE